MNDSATTNWKHPLPKASSPTEERLQPYNQSLLAATDIYATTLFYLCTNREGRHRPHKDTNPFCQLRLM